MRIQNGILAIALGTLVAAGTLVAGCSDDAPAKSDGGTTPTGTTTTTTTTTPTGTGTSASTLYTRLGGQKGIRDDLVLIVMEELKDAETASYFAGIGANGRPNQEQIVECLTNQLSSAAQGPEKYPGVPADNKGWQCRNMKDSHKDLGIPKTIFVRFVATAAGVLKKAGVSDADIGVIGGVLNSTEADIVDPSRTGDGGSFIPKDAGPG